MDDLPTTRYLGPLELMDNRSPRSAPLATAHLSMYPIQAFHTFEFGSHLFLSAKKPNPQWPICQGSVWLSVIQFRPSRPPNSPLSIIESISLVGADRYMNIRAFVCKNILPSSQFTAPFAILGPNKCIV